MQENVSHGNISIITAICQWLRKNIVFIIQKYNIRTYDRESVFFYTGSRRSIYNQFYEKYISGSVLPDQEYPKAYPNLT
jgi:hypothetical protein